MRLAVLTICCLGASLVWDQVPVAACPSCQNAVPAPRGPDDEDDPLMEARAYNRSIYFMVSMPYLLLAGVGLLVYRGYRNTKGQANAEPAPPADDAELRVADDASAEMS